VKIRLATRGSKLAIIQAQLAADALKQRHPEHEFLLQPLTTHGDRHPAMKLTESSREGVFIKELEKALLEGVAELAVHSAKDLPTRETPGLVLAAFLPRADARDVLISRDSATVADLPRGARVGTGSPRRAAQLANLRPDLVTQPIRGNVDTRLRRLEEGVVDALVLAAAGMERLGRLESRHQLLPFDVMLPAPGQGALAIQALEGSVAAQLAAAVNDWATSRAVRAERALLQRLGGGCLSALGAFAAVQENEIELRAVVLDPTGQQVLRANAAGADDASVVEEVASRLVAQGAGSLLAGEAEPLSGMRILVTRPDGQAQDLVDRLSAAGASVIACPVIEIRPMPADAGRIAGLEPDDWLVLTSANGVDRLLDLLKAGDLRPATHIKVAAIGPETAARLRDRGVEPALVPDRYIAEELAERLLEAIAPGRRVVLARAAGARDVLPERLRAHGVAVEVIELYRAEPPENLAAKLQAVLASGVDMVTFTSSSTVRHFVEAAGSLAPTLLRVACIGPITAQTARELGLRVDIIADEYTARGLVDAIVRSRSPVSA
jgi:hydroxymethylbilane synthase